MVAVAHRMPGAHPSQRALEPSEHGSRGQRRVQSEVRAAQKLASLYSRSDEGETIYILEPQSGSAQWSWMLRFGCAGTRHAVWCDGSRLQCGVHAMVKRMGVRAMAGRERTRCAPNGAPWRAPEIPFLYNNPTRKPPSCIKKWPVALSHIAPNIQLDWKRISSIYTNTFLSSKDFHLHYKHILHRAIITRHTYPADHARAEGSARPVWAAHTYMNTACTSLRSSHNCCCLCNDVSPPAPSSVSSINVTVTALLSLRFIFAAIATLLAVISFLSLALKEPRSEKTIRGRSISAMCALSVEFAHFIIWGPQVVV
eukprot:scaffold12376_cov143-Isochrysis_galbana.AAC.2